MTTTKSGLPAPGEPELAPELTEAEAEGLRRAVEEAERGARGMPLEDFMDEIREEIDALARVRRRAG